MEGVEVDQISALSLIQGDFKNLLDEPHLLVSYARTRTGCNQEKENGVRNVRIKQTKG